MLTLGETAILLVLIPPDQVYVLAPFAVKVMFSPMHIVPVVPLIVILGSAFVGSLAYTFSDSFWFSAVEAEVYAMSSFFTAIVIWAFLKWDVIKDPKEENRWLVFIAYLVGLSIGVHLLNLVTLPALALLYYFKKNLFNYSIKLVF